MSTETGETRTATAEIAVAELTCSDCAGHVFDAVSNLQGVQKVETYVSTGRVKVFFDPTLVSITRLEAALKNAGYTPISEKDNEERSSGIAGESLKSANVLFFVVAAIAVAATLAEQFGFLEGVLERVPWWFLAAAVLLGGWKVFANVWRAATKAKVTSHALMTIGVMASAATGMWTTALLIVFFMRFADWLEDVTNEKSKNALKELIGLKPQKARVIRSGVETEIPVDQVQIGDEIVVRSGDKIPVDGKIVDGEAPVDEAPITGESIPIDKKVGDSVFAATIAQAGYLRIVATKVGADTTFSQIIKLVEEAEAQQAPVQRFADKFTGYYLPAILAFALITYYATGRITNAVAVLVVACACAITMATPVVVLASVGNAAKRGLLIKGGAALENLAKIDTIVMDKTGTVTYGRPQVTDVTSFNVDEDRLLQALADLENRSEHPLAMAIVAHTRKVGVTPNNPLSFQSLSGRGISGELTDGKWFVGNRTLLSSSEISLDPHIDQSAKALEGEGKTVFFAARENQIVGMVALADELRQDALEVVRSLSTSKLHMLLLTGDNQRAAQSIANRLGIDYLAELLPDQKIAEIRKLQESGRRVLMIGDGVNDAPALAAADVGLAMGHTGSGVALETADVILMREDWRMVPKVIKIGKRAAVTIRQNLAFTAAYNLLGITLAFVGILPPSWAAAGQALPDVAIMLNSARLAKG